MQRHILRVPDGRCPTGAAARTLANEPVRLPRGPGEPRSCLWLDLRESALDACAPSAWEGVEAPGSLLIGVPGRTRSGGRGGPGSRGGGGGGGETGTRPVSQAAGVGEVTANRTPQGASLLWS